MNKKYIGITFILFLVLNFTTVYAQAAANEDAKLTSEQSQSIWKYQVQSVAQELGLTKEQSSKLEEIYLAARKDQKQALKGLPEEADRVKARAATQEVNTKEKAKLENSLKAVLNAEQIAKALPLLGSFNPRYDSYVKYLIDLNLDKDKMNSALKEVGIYASGYAKARGEAEASGSRFSATISKELKGTLDASLTKILTPEQLVKWAELSASGKAK